MRMKRIPFIFFCLYVVALAMEIKGVKSLYIQSEKLLPCISFENGTYDLFAKLRLPNKKQFYISPNGLREEKTKYTHITDRSYVCLFKENPFVYEKSKWLPQGDYKLTVSLESEGETKEIKDINFSFLSHTITFPKYLNDKNIYNYKVLPSINDTLWIIYEQYDSSLDGKEKDRLFAMRIDENANILVPPFEIARSLSNPMTRSAYGWSVTKEKKGGFFLFYNKYNEQYKNYRDLVGTYFNADGEKKVQKIIWQEFHGSKTDDPFEKVVDSYTDRDRNLSIIFAFSSKSTIDMLLVHKGVKKVSISSKSEKENFKTYYDYDEGKIYLIINHNNTFMFNRYDINGTLEINKDITNIFHDDLQIKFGYYEKQKEIVGTDKGIVFLYPKNGFLAYVLFDKDGNILKSKKIMAPNLNMFINTDKYDIAKHDNLLWMTAISGSKMYLLSTDTNEIILFSSFKKSNPVHPSITELGQNIFVTIRSSSLEGYFLGNDKPLGEPDLAFAKQNMIQKPYFAKLGEKTLFSFDIFNVGEANSSNSALTIGYMGKIYQKNIPQIEPKTRYEINVSLPQPSYLTQKPKMSLSITPEDTFNENNSFTNQVRFSLDTPIYPKKAKKYSWNIVDSVDDTPISHVHVSYLYKNLEVVSGEKKDIHFVLKSNDEGKFSTILEDGNYTFILSKYGDNYPKTIITKEIPNDTETFFLKAAGDLHINFTQDDGDTLHPTPQQVALTIRHHYSEDMPDWTQYVYSFKGDEKGAQIKRVMPGEYNLSIQAFGYKNKKINMIEVESKTKKEYTVELTPLPRGNICGKVIDADEKSVSDATVSLIHFPYYVITDDDGIFCLQDLEKGRSYTLEISKTDYLPVFYTFTLDEANLSVGQLTLPKIDYKSIDLPKCRYGAWSQDIKWDDPKNSYEIKDLYGVWDMQGYLYYSQAQEQTQAHLLMLNINVDGLLWTYYGLDGHVVKAIVNWGLDALSDIAEGAAEALGGTLQLITKYVIKVKELKDFADDLSDWANMPENYVAEYRNLSNPMGTVKGGVVDCGNLDVLGGLQRPTDSTPQRDKTILRFDDIQIVKNGSIIYSSHKNGWKQYYTDTTDTITVPLNIKVDNMQNIHVKLYVAVMNGEYDSGPLALPGSDHLLLQYKISKGKLHLEKIECSPMDYPSFTY